MKADFYIDATKLKIAMARACLSNRKLAFKAGLAPETLSRVFRNSSGQAVGVTGLTLGKLARALNVDILDLVVSDKVTA